MSEERYAITEILEDFYVVSETIDGVTVNLKGFTTREEASGYMTRLNEELTKRDNANFKEQLEELFFEEFKRASSEPKETSENLEELNRIEDMINFDDDFFNNIELNPQPISNEDISFDEFRTIGAIFPEVLDEEEFLSVFKGYDEIENSLTVDKIFENFAEADRHHEYAASQEDLLSEQNFWSRTYPGDNESILFLELDEENGYWDVSYKELIAGRFSSQEEAKDFYDLLHSLISRIYTDIIKTLS